jgi:hypothetical protein
MPHSSNRGLSGAPDWRCGKFGLEGEVEVQFELKGQSYMLNFNPQDERWYLVTAGLGGMAKAIPVFEDEEGFVPNMVAPVHGSTRVN